MASINENKYFLQLLAYDTNYKQNVIALKEINEDQCKLLKNIANDVLEEYIHLNSQQFKTLLQYKNFIRKLGREKVIKVVLSKNLPAIIELAKLVLTNLKYVQKLVSVPIEEWEN